MRALQLIDSLEAGGAERMAVTLANALIDSTQASYLCTTRFEGPLKESLQHDVGYLFLNKKSTFDLKALFRLRKFVKNNGIGFIHAHTTSFFFATLLKMIYPGVKLIWHEHHGEKVNSKILEHKALYFCSFFFHKIITVNEDLKQWCLNNLKTKQVTYLPNFVDVKIYDLDEKHRMKTIICLANLRDPKNHMNLLKAYKIVHSKFPEWKLQLVGQDIKDSYSKEIKQFIKVNQLAGVVDILGARTNIIELLNKASIGVLSSDSEGLPMALLEYGASKLAVVVTRVGYCKEVVGNYGKLIPVNDPMALANSITLYIEDENLRFEDAYGFQQHVCREYSLRSTLPKLMSIYR
jgi:glycosyltransferase involved in cell wall biosynthesis